MAGPSFSANSERIVVIQNYIRRLIIAVYILFSWVIILTVFLGVLTIIAPFKTDSTTTSTGGKLDIS